MRWRRRPRCARGGACRTGANEPYRNEDGRQVSEVVTAFEKLGKHVVTGWLRAYVVTVPSRQRRVSPWFEELVALETSDASPVGIQEIEPADPPPNEPLRVDVPADQAYLCGLLVRVRGPQTAPWDGWTTPTRIWVRATSAALPAYPRAAGACRMRAWPGDGS